jgi:hypothetical protein
MSEMIAITVVLPGWLENFKPMSLEILNLVKQYKYFKIISRDG